IVDLVSDRAGIDGELDATLRELGAARGDTVIGDIANDDRARVRCPDEQPVRVDQMATRDQRLDEIRRKRNREMREMGREMGRTHFLRDLCREMGRTHFLRELCNCVRVPGSARSTASLTLRGRVHLGSMKLT
ncbi:MAG: hypothetical protein ABI704_22515, partial [Kofleriaceae bacterium]